MLMTVQLWTVETPEKRLPSKKATKNQNPGVLKIPGFFLYSVLCVWEVLSPSDMPLAVRLIAAVKNLLNKLSGEFDPASSLENIFRENLEQVITLASEFVSGKEIDKVPEQNSAAAVIKQNLTADEKVQSDIIHGNIGKYFSDVKDALRSLYKKAFSRKELNRDFVNFAEIGDAERAMLTQISGIDMSNAKVHAIDESGVRHIDNRHGKNESRSDQSPITENDIVKIPEIVDGTRPEYLGKNSDGNHTFQYRKKIGNEYFYLEEYRSGRGKLSGVSFWKKINDTDAAPTSTENSNGKPTPEALRPRVDTNTIPQSSENSSAFVMKDGESLKNDSGEPVLIYHDKAPNGAIWGNKRFRSDNAYGIANYAIVGDDAHIRMTSSGGSGKKYLFFTIPDFRNQTISEIQQAVQKIDPDSTYPLGRNFDDVLNALHDHGMRVYPSGLKPLQNASASANRNRETAVPEKGTVKENLEVTQDTSRSSDKSAADEGTDSQGHSAAGRSAGRGNREISEVSEESINSPAVELPEKLSINDRIRGKGKELSGNLDDDLLKIINSDQKAATKNAMMKRFAAMYNFDEKSVQELVESKIVTLVKTINKENISDEEKFKKLVELYNRQPALSKRTSTSIRNQAYSTPAPLAWALGKRIGIDKASRVYEPTAGTGMLVAIADRNKTFVNELNGTRANILHNLGFTHVTEKNALEYAPEGEFSHIIMNPPFGNAESKVVDGFNLSKLDHQIAAKALSKLSENGKAAIIVGANEMNRTTGKPTSSDWVFLNYLYNNFNVADNFVVDGSLYSKQGASYPVRVITINGRKKSQNITSLAPTEIEKVKSWDILYDKLKGILYAERKTGAVQSSGENERNDNGSGREHGNSAQRGNGLSGLPQNNAETDRSTNDRGGRRSGTGFNAEPERQSVSDLGQNVSDGVQRKLSGTRDIRNDRRGDSELRSDNGVLQRDGKSAAETGNTGSGRSGGRGYDNDTGKSVSVPARVGLVKKGKTVSNLHSEYAPGSNSTPLGTVVPNYMADGLVDALNRLQEKHGNIDEFVRQELGYDTLEEMYSGLAAEQVDGVALAIDSIQRGTGFIIGDQTGVGKGRQAAALQKWAIRHGKIPVFFTATAKLFSDMYGDGKDIHATFSPIVIGGGDEADIVDKATGETIVKHTKSKTAGKPLQKLIDQDGTYDALWTTYSQVSKAGDDTRKLIEKLVDTGKALIIMDEAHEAAGDSKTGMFFRGGTTKPKKDKNGNKVPGESFKGILKNSDVVYFSATFAKRPDNMPLYFRTSISKAIDDMSKLPSIMTKGGEPLQQWISQGLAADGQMKRSERDFTGVTFDPVVYEPKNISAIRNQYDRVAEALRAMIDHSNMVNTIIEDKLAYGKANTQEDQATQANSFASNTHNFISSLLLALKLDTVAERAANAVKNGEKPVIALMETKGSFLGDYIKDNGLKVGDKADVKFSDILIAAVNRMYKATEKEPSGKRIDHEFSPDDLGLTMLHNALISKIRNLDIDLPASPIDYLRHKLEEKGVKTGEITGRESVLDYSGKFPVIGKRSKQDKDSKTQIRLFNSGDIDAIILNSAGSTGISLHADKRFKDRKPRKMFMIQPSLDIAVVMQMFGRVLRSGQVVSPSYEIFSLALPAEKRPTMVLAKKMRSLNANTSANAKGNVDFGVDVLNKYGDQIAAEYLSSHSDIAKQTGITLSYDSNGEVNKVPEDLMRKFLGKVAVLSNAVQEKIYKEISESYTEYVDELKARGDYDLELESHDDWDVKTADAEKIVSGDDASIFTSPVTRKAVSIKTKRNIPSQEFVNKEIKNAFGGKDLDTVIANLEKQTQPLRDAIEKMDKTVWVDKDDKFIAERKEANRRRIEDFISWVKRNFNYMLSIQEEDNQYFGVISDIKVTGEPDPKNPAMNAFKVRFTVGDNVTHLTFPFRQILGGKAYVVPTRMVSFADTFTGEKQEVREDRFIFTGNLLKAFELVGDKGKGKVVTYMTDSGKRETGILMSKKWKSNEMSRDPRNELASAEDAFNELKKSDAVYTLDGYLSIRKHGYDRYRLVANKKKRDGGRYFLDDQLIDIAGDFFSYGNVMRTDSFSEADAKEIIDYLYKENKLRKASNDNIAFSLSSDFSEDVEKINAEFNADIDRQIAGTLPKGYIYQLGTPGDILLSTGVPDLPIELSSSHLDKKSKQENHPFEIADLKNLPQALHKPVAVFPYGDAKQAQNIIVEIQKDGKNFLIGLSLNYTRDGLDVNSIRGLFPKDFYKWLMWIQNGEALYLNKEKVQNLIAQQRTNLADLNNLNLNSINNIIQNFQNSSVIAKNPENSSGTFLEDDGTEIAFSLRDDAPPEKTKTGYKVFAVFKSKPGQLFPPMVANPGGESTPTGVWLNADAAPRAEDSKTGRPRVQAGGKGTNTGKQTLAYRPGWHLGEVPQALQFNRKNPENGKKELFPEHFVWAECEFAADVDYQKEAESYGYNAKGNFQHSLAGLPKIPVDGYYKYRTNPDPETEPWFITGAMKVKRILSDKEVNAILEENGYPEMKRQGGEIDLADWGLDNIAFSLADDRQPDSENKPAMSEEKEQSLLSQVKKLFDDAKTVVDKKWVMLNRQAYPVLYRTVFPTASKVPETPSPREMEIMNMVLENGSMAEAALIAEHGRQSAEVALMIGINSSTLRNASARLAVCRLTVLRCPST